MRKADNLPPYHAVVMKSGRLNFLEPSGPAQACYGRTLPLLGLIFWLFNPRRKSLWRALNERFVSPKLALSTGPNASE